MSDQVHLKSIEIEGFRGFQTKRSVSFAVPNGQLGSGLTVITGPNNAGKSTIIEALKIREAEKISFHVGMRNTKSELVTINYHFQKNELPIQETIKSNRKGSSETQKSATTPGIKFFSLPSRRAFEPYFNSNITSRDNYISRYTGALNPNRRSSLSSFELRLFNIELHEGNKINFDNLICRLLGYTPEWAIDQTETGQYFLKFINNHSSHSSDGMGEGVVSLFVIADALYESKPNEVIIIDEPELSLHPSLQKRLATVLNEYSQNRQIIIATHSPYFVDLHNLQHGAALARVISGKTGTEIFQLSNTKIINKLLSNQNNPHILEARC